MSGFIGVFKGYLFEILPALALGFFLSGIIHEFIPGTLVEKHLGQKGLKPILYATITGTLLPICCWGSLPIAVSFYMKGASLGSVLAFLVATPATSISALLVTWKLLGLKFAAYVFFSVILMGLVMGVIGNHIKFKPRIAKDEICPHCKEDREDNHICKEKDFTGRVMSLLKFAFWDLPREIGIDTLIGLLLATIVSAVVPIGMWVKNYLRGGFGYLFALIFGLVMYFCATASVPLVHAFLKQGMNVGAGLALLLVGPITSYGTILVLRKEFGYKILLVYLATISILSIMLGYLFSFIY